MSKSNLSPKRARTYYEELICVVVASCKHTHINKLLSLRNVHMYCII